MSRYNDLMMLPVSASLMWASAGITATTPITPDLAVQVLTPPRLIAFDGLRELAAASSRIGMLAQRLDYTLEVGADGKATSCTLTRKFRSPLVTKQLCEVLMRRSRFEPARDAWGTAVNGGYTGRINFDMSIKPDR